MIRFTLPFASAIALAACTTSHPALADGPVPLGKAVRVDGPTVRPLKVVEDSRCPANVRCVWAGRLILRVEVSGGSRRRMMNLTLGEPGIAVADGKLRLVSVTPARMVDKPFPSSAYRFGFAFEGGI